MVERITIDSSVIIAALLEKEAKHKECKALFEKVKNGEYLAVEPLIVMVEIVAAIKRRTGSSPLQKGLKRISATSIQSCFSRLYLTGRIMLLI